MIRSLLGVALLLVAGTVSAAESAEAIATEAHLPRSAAGYTLVSAKRNRANHDLQLLYRKDKQTLSVFVSKAGGQHRPSADWKVVHLSRKRTAYGREDKKQAAMAWTGERGYRFITVCRGSLKTLQPFVEAVFTAPPASPRR